MVYTYKCREDEHMWEVDHSMHVNDAVTELGLRCPVCGSENIFKFLGNMKTAYIQFKGLGFAVNDHALDKINFPKHYRDNPEIRDKLKDTI